ncbi:MAG: alginate O-acetyltransferase AlgX-related protein [Acidobacteriota bacterium]
MRRALIGFFLAVIYAVPLVQAGIEIARGERPKVFDLFTARPTAANLRGYENGLENASVFERWTRPWMQYAWFAALGDPGEKAVAGRDGWFFYKPDVRYLVEPDRNAGALAAILKFREQLAARGIGLIVMPVPGKPSVYPAQLTRRAADGASVASHTQDLIASLRAKGVETLDVLEALQSCRKGGDPCYLMRDTHWSGATARRVAELAAGRIRERGWFAGGTTDYTAKPVRIERPGDVIRMMDVPSVERGFAPEHVWCEQVVAQSNGALYKDDASSPVLVLGDSFLRMYQTDAPGAAGFIAHLARALHTPLASIVNDGGASTLVRQQLARRPGLLAGKKVVLWEFVERDIRFGADGWQDVALPD